MPDAEEAVQVSEFQVGEEEEDGARGNLENDLLPRADGDHVILQADKEEHYHRGGEEGQACHEPAAGQQQSE